MSCNRRSLIREHDFQAKYAAIVPRLDERQRRLIAAADALFLGRGGVSSVSRASGRSRTTMHRGRAELDAGSAAARHLRKAGGGRKRMAEPDPALLQALEALVEPLPRGAPRSPWRWTCQSTRPLAEALRPRGHPIRAPTVAVRLHDRGYRVQANTKTREGTHHPERDQPCQSINTPVKKYGTHQAPVISVETPKPELGGPDHNPGQAWSRTGRPRHVTGHEFPDKTRGQAIPSGLDDMGPNGGWVNVGGDHDTASVAIASRRRGWRQLRQPR
jgi:Rhodopirellula transposase DDE domain